MTRAWLSFFQLDIKAAFYYHPLFWLVPIIFGVVLLRNKSTICQKIYKNKYFFNSMIVLFIGTYIIRMFYMFPQTSPMDFNENAPLIQFIKMIIQ